MTSPSPTLRGRGIEEPDSRSLLTLIAGAAEGDATNLLVQIALGRAAGLHLLLQLQTPSVLRERCPISPREVGELKSRARKEAP